MNLLPGRRRPLPRIRLHLNRYARTAAGLRSDFGFPDYLRPLTGKYWPGLGSSVPLAPLSCHCRSEDPDSVTLLRLTLRPEKLDLRYPVGFQSHLVPVVLGFDSVCRVVDCCFVVAGVSVLGDRESVQTLLHHAVADYHPLELNPLAHHLLAVHLLGGFDHHSRSTEDHSPGRDLLRRLALCRQPFSPTPV